MPKTRSGKIMRRVLAAISNHMDTGDITTLANPDIVEQIRELVQGRNVGPLKRSEEHTSELSQSNLVCRLLLEKKKKTTITLWFTSTTPIYTVSNVVSPMTDQTAQ